MTDRQNESNDGNNKSRPNPLSDVPDGQGTSEDHGLPLDRLTAAYAQFFDEEQTPHEDVPQTSSHEKDREGSHSAKEKAALFLEEEQATLADEQEQHCPLTPLSILESLLFVGNVENRPLTGKKIASLMRGVSEREIEQMVEELNQAYQEEYHVFRVIRKESGYQMILHPELESLRQLFYGKVKEAKLSQAAIDTLAIIAYKPGIPSKEIDQLRGRESKSILAQLVRRNLLRFERDSKNRRTQNYYTTDRFLDFFNLASLDDLPLSNDTDLI
ncbi:MAG: SMC-Scp complex subunit ScpB [Pirellulaceae bacterium]|nr:SMC-Scp complex subunit ScpB [Pirellulaceae bacterium]